MARARAGDDKHLGASALATHAFLFRVTPIRSLSRNYLRINAGEFYNSATAEGEGGCSNTSNESLFDR